MLGLLWTIVIGAVVGALAKFVMPGKDSGGFFLTAGLGIAGAFVAKFLGQAIGWYQEGQRAGFIASTLGAILILAIYRRLKKPGATAAKS
jgi:uncharacterized membrane protein YeaQ/YmgE (transglycosylase-associated protein family)